MGNGTIPQNERERKAEATVFALAERHGMTVDALGTRIMYDLCNGVPDLATADRLTDLFWATQRINGNGSAPRPREWECNCVLPSQSCPTCEAAARAVYGDEWEVL